MKTLSNNTATQNTAVQNAAAKKAASKKAAEQAAQNDALILVPAAKSTKVRTINKAPKAAKRLAPTKAASKKTAVTKKVAAAPKKAVTKKTAKKAAPKAPKKVGVIKTMVTLLKRKQHTAKQLHEALILAFPERDSLALSRTVRAQTCGQNPRLQKEQKISLKITLNSKNVKVFKIAK